MQPPVHGHLRQQCNACGGKCTGRLRQLVFDCGLRAWTVADDKSKHSCWLVPNEVYAANLFLFVHNSPFWHFADVTAQDANLVIQRALSMRRDHSDQNWPIAHLWIHKRQKSVAC